MNDRTHHLILLSSSLSSIVEQLCNTGELSQALSILAIIFVTSSTSHVSTILSSNASLSVPPHLILSVRSIAG